MTGHALPDARARRLIRTALDRNVVVEAAAGTGKTTELVHRIIAVLAEGHTAVERIVVVTFTEKAAGELKLRLRTGLEEARQCAAEPQRRAALEHALAHLEEAHVNTIHGFCADLLRERPVEAGVDPRFATMTEGEADGLYREAFDLWLQEQLEDPPPGVRRSLRRTSKARLDDGPSGRLRAAGAQLAMWRDFPAPWRRDPFPRERALDDAVERLRAFAELSACCTRRSDPFFADTECARRLSEDIRACEAARARDYDQLEAALVDLAHNRDFGRRAGSGARYGEGVSREQVRAAHGELSAHLRALARALDADLAALLQGELLESVRRYEELKARAGKLDFVDLLVRARDLVRDNDAVREEFQRRFTHFFVDEFQDTDPLQAEILFLLAAADPHCREWLEARPAAGKLFIVGDPKQSIYRFRRADVGIYRIVKEKLEQWGATSVRLSTSFRSVPAIQRAVNAAFAPRMTAAEPEQQAGYVPLQPWRGEPVGRPAVVALAVPEPYGAARITAAAIERSTPEAVGGFVDWLLRESGWKVTERDNPGREVPITARHVCLLFRRLESYGEDVTRPYVRALEARSVAHLLVGGKSFHDREEVEAMRAALAAIEWPEDELSVFATLRGSLFAVGDEELLEYRDRFGRLHPFRLPGGDGREVPEHLHPIIEALQLLQTLHRKRNRRAVAETIHHLLHATRAHAGFVLRPSGEQVLANVLHIAERARAYEEGGGLSFRGFVEQLREEAQRRAAAEAPILEEGSDGVRLMTVHKAKGLEFPVVILADITARLARSEASRYLDPERRLCALRIGGWSPAELLEHEAEEMRREEAEAVRIAYVAATRARDVLVVPAVGDGPFAGGWASPLNAAIYPARDACAVPQAAPGCPSFGRDSVLHRPGGMPGADTVRPGLYRMGSGGESYDVVWWDPSRLRLGVEPLFGLRQQELLGEAGEAPLQADLDAYRAWEQARQAALQSASRPRFQVLRATQQAELAGDPATVDVEVVSIEPVHDRPHGARFGTLVHAVLAAVALDDAAAVASTAAVQGRLLGAPAEEVEAAAEAVRRALGHPLLARACRAWRGGRCRRESPVTWRAADGSIVEGVVDLAFEENGEWVVVDFKTDRELGPSLDIYRRQVALYAQAIAASTGCPASAVLLRV